MTSISILLPRMNAVKFRISRAFVFALCFSSCALVAQEKQRAPRNPFENKLQVAKNVYVENQTQFSKWAGAKVSLGDYLPESYSRTRLGTIDFAPGKKLHLDAVDNLVHFPSYFELVEPKSEKIVGKFPNYDISDVRWFFPGNGIAYLNQKHLNMCGPQYTRKFVLQAGAMVEVKQPLYFIDAETDVLSAATLYESANGGKVVANLLPGTKVQVVGVLPGKDDFWTMAYLVKTPLGLTGWHTPKPNQVDGELDIYMCN